jgi:hypothetical protein
LPRVPFRRATRRLSPFMRVGTRIGASSKEPMIDEKPHNDAEKPKDDADQQASAPILRLFGQIDGHHVNSWAGCRSSTRPTHRSCANWYIKSFH